MDIQLTEEQRQVRDLCREFADRELKPHARRWDRDHEFPAAAVKQLGEMGLMGVAVPAEWGGAGMDNVSYALAMEEISRGCAGTGVIMSVSNSLYCDPVLKYGSDAQRKEFLEPYARGEKLGCFALTEPMSGSDAAEMRTVAVRRGDEYVLDGTKNFITNGPQADAVLVFAMTDKAKRHKGISAFLVPTDARGFSRGKPDDKVGIRASGSCSLFFEGCAIPARHRLGEEGDGFKIAMGTLDGGRIGIAGQALGIAVAAFEEAVAYAKERKAFGQPITQFQAIQFMLADMATEIDAARLLVLRAASAKDRGVRHSAESAMAKLFASEMSERVTSKAIQIHGGYGYVKEFDVERHWRDSRITEIYEGTSEIQRLVISASVLKG
ncbi:acyl-CoA dehydrogenase domain protein [Anaeromyxobacter dehalogenans 2CP-1]|uniref:Cyclohex-1-ene-1-carbonyl-CoA dehydrogenase n=1 Tax=Anaeromyxobacter dehalogenans (strain ATCC BAA-258 / DSM 21875 / 2CP-1) TaxID=455488 RepID=B8JAA0_ANAD2|nr:acyl-CoA dehydrogenase [Anaeromyxobacter dehalogenans]ACL65619.1 acyl-CoA dehydrogenase domain protein [Anaeromyxobacter dehalogenans 2CP-1]